MIGLPTESLVMPRERKKSAERWKKEREKSLNAIEATRFKPKIITDANK